MPGGLWKHTYPQVDLHAVSHSGLWSLLPDVYVSGGTALHLAALYGYDTIVGQLLQAKANPRAVDKDGQTALQLAERNGKQDVVQRLRQVHSP